MMQTLEATLDESGAPASPPMKTITARGAMKGMLSSVDEFIANKAAEIVLEEKR